VRLVGGAIPGKSKLMGRRNWGHQGALWGAGRLPKCYPNYVYRPSKGKGPSGEDKQAARPKTDPGSKTRILTVT